MWRNVRYRNIPDFTYEVSNDGQIREWHTDNILKQKKNKNGYMTVLMCGKRHLVHRVVLSSFSKHGEEKGMQVDHVNGHKDDNRLCNLEWVTGAENIRRARKLGLMQTCEDQYKAIFTNDQVRQMCELFQKGYNVRKVVKVMGLHKQGYGKIQLDYNINRIVHRQAWTDITKDYDWDIDDIRLKKYTKKDLQKIAYLILYSDLKYKEIANLFPQYGFKQVHQVIKKMAQGKLYKSIMKEVERSTTIDNFVDQMMLEGYC